MTQAHKGTIARRGVQDRSRLVGAANATLAVIAAGMSAALILPSFLPEATISTTPAAVDQVIVDGWMPAAASAQTARLERVQDGYLSGLLLAQPSVEAVDGWMPSLLGERPAGSGAYGSDPRDGWDR